jgi:Phosphoenolpyruvate phosphomutase
MVEYATHCVANLLSRSAGVESVLSLTIWLSTIANLRASATTSAEDSWLRNNIWDAGSAKGVATGGAKAIATSSWSVANAHGFADGERIPLAFAMTICAGSSAQPIHP